MAKRRDGQVETALSHRLQSLIASADTGELTPLQVESLVSRLIICLQNFIGDASDYQNLDNMVQNALQANDAFIESIVEDQLAGDEPHHGLPALCKAVKPHIISCVCLNRTPEDFALRVNDIIYNYLHDGELVEVLKGRTLSPNHIKLIDAVQAYLRRVALGKLRCEAQEIDDLIQATWVKLLEKLDGFHFLARFRVWAVTILYQTFCDEMRRVNSIKAGGKSQKVSLFKPIDQDDPAITIAETLTTQQADPEEELLHNLLITLVSDHIEKYRDEFYKEVGRRGILEQAKAEDIATELNLPPQKVYNLLFKIRQRLRQTPGIRPGE